MLKDIEENPYLVISLISSGEEAGGEATPFRVGTLAEVESVQKQGDFQYIRPRGIRRVYLDSFDRESKPYMTAECTEYKDEPEIGSVEDQLPQLEAKILKRIASLGPEESRGIHQVLNELKEDLDRENYSLFLCGSLDLPSIYLQRLLESRSQKFRIENALNLFSKSE